MTTILTYPFNVIVCGTVNGNDRHKRINQYK